MQSKTRLLIAAAALAVLAFFLFVPPITQDQAYHFFGDNRTILGIPNFWNLVSNLPFALVRLLGLWKLCGVADRILFTGVLLTFFGSAYYHLAPSDSRLVWDRLPMTLVFMALLACVIEVDNWLLAVFLACGVASVLWWNVTNDLRPYVLVQFGPLLFLIPALWFLRNARYLGAVLAFYAFAKLAEFYDRGIFSALPISGHTIKHVLAAIATYYIFRWRLATAGDKHQPQEHVWASSFSSSR